MVPASNQPHAFPTARRVVRLARPAAVAVTMLATTLGVAGRASAAPSTKITASITGTALTVTGTNGRDDLSLRLRNGDPTTLEVVDNAQNVTLAFNRNDFDTIRVFALDGDDTIKADESNGAFTDTEATNIFGGAGNDTLQGGIGSERIVGGPGDDFVNGGRGNDVAFLEAGDDTFVWNPGDGSDTVEGDDGADTMLFNGANINEKVDISANGSRVLFTRDVANITMDLNQVENIDFTAQGGADTVAVNDLSGTGVTDVNTDLAATPGSGTGDAAADNVVVNGTPTDDTINVGGANGTADVTGTAAAVHVTGGEPTLDTLNVNGLAGNDQITADPAAGATIGVVVDGGADNDTVTTNGTNHADTFTLAPNGTLVAVDNGTGFYSASAENLNINGLAGNDSITAGNGLAPLTQLTIDGGDGNDNIVGGDGADLIIAGHGRDTVNGGRGNDVAFLGTASDTFVWNPGDGSDTVEGESGNDTMIFNGAGVNENVTLSANGSRLRFFRDVATVTMDVDGVENVAFTARGGDDNVTVNNLGDTAVNTVAIDLAGTPGSGTGDGAADHVQIIGTNGNDHVQVRGSDGEVSVKGLAPDLTITGAEFANDRLDISTLTGNDKVHSHLAANNIGLFVNGSAF